ncbi:MAG: hypothetical protein R2753_00940 [Chitinophagales bacterium]
MATTPSTTLWDGHWIKTMVRLQRNILCLRFPSSAYNWLTPAELGCCNDVFVMPHADPTWEDHSNLMNWNDSYTNGGCEGTIWAACHAVSCLRKSF